MDNPRRMEDKVEESKSSEQFENLQCGKVSVCQCYFLPNQFLPRPRSCRKARFIRNSGDAQLLSVTTIRTRSRET